MADTLPPSSPETVEALQTRHRKEQRDLVSRMTQKKKQATKKTRKGVNDECERLEREQKERQEAELAALNRDAAGDEDQVHQDEDEDEEQELAVQTSALNVNGSAPSSSTPSTNGDAEADADEPEAAGGRKKKPNRAKARLARRAAETSAIIAQAEREAASAPNPRALERERMATQLELHKLALHEIRADGHCLYAAVADQLATRELGVTPRIEVTIAGSESAGQAQGGYKAVRYAAADWIQAHPDNFAGFMEDALPEHVRKIRETAEWGGHVELLALAQTYGITICVLHSDGRVDRMEAEEKEGKEGKEIWLGYYKHSHGLGEHYNSLRKIG